MVVLTSPAGDAGYAGLPPPLQPIGSGPVPAPTSRPKRRLRAVVVLTLLVVLVGAAAAALFLMRG
jgi:hypothetical protein